MKGVRNSGAVKDVFELVKLQPGVASNDLVQALEGTYTAQNVYNAAYGLVKQGKLKKIDGFYYPADYANGKLPAHVTAALSEAHKPVATQAAQSAATLSEFQRKRDKRIVTVQEAPKVYETVLRLILDFQGKGRITIPIFDNVRVCTGPGIPEWSPDQETYRGVTNIVIVQGTREDIIPVSASAPITIAPGS